MALDIVFYRLQNQRLSGSKLNTPANVVSWLGAVQAQDYAGAKWAIGQRMKGATDAMLEQAMTDGSILRTHLLRPTWHFVTPDDIRWMLELTAPRVRALMTYMDRQLELDTITLKKSNTALIKTLRGGKQMTRAELGSALQKSGINTDTLRLGHIMMHAELDGVVCSGPRHAKQFTYALLEERVPAAKVLTRDEALAELVTRYFQSYGPATLQDFGVWSGLTITDARLGIEMVKSKFVSNVIDGQTYWYKETKPINRKKSLTAYLLPNYDEFFIGFKDRSAIGRVALQAGDTEGQSRADCTYHHPGWTAGWWLETHTT
ncbi:MAG: winged helix DNA-binding domain-containing protein [Chloroflexota bacterium]